MSNWAEVIHLPDLSRHASQAGKLLWIQYFLEHIFPGIVKTSAPLRGLRGTESDFIFLLFNFRHLFMFWFWCMHGRPDIRVEMRGQLLSLHLVLRQDLVCVPDLVHKLQAAPPISVSSPLSAGVLGAQVSARKSQVLCEFEGSNLSY